MSVDSPSWCYVWTYMYGCMTGKRCMRRKCLRYDIIGRKKVRWRKKFLGWSDELRLNWTLGKVAWTACGRETEDGDRSSNGTQRRHTRRWRTVSDDATSMMAEGKQDEGMTHAGGGKCTQRV